MRDALQILLGKAQRIVEQSASRKNKSEAPKLYAWQAPEVECIAKGKSRIPYEFGVKVGIAATLKHNLIVGARSFAGKPYGRGNNPATAAKAFLIENDHFEVDHDIEDQVIMTLSPDGFLRRAR